MLSATPCKGSNGINERAKGLDGEDGGLIRAAATVMEQVRAKNPNVKILMENVVLTSAVTASLQSSGGLAESDCGIFVKTIGAAA